MVSLFKRFLRPCPTTFGTRRRRTGLEPAVLCSSTASTSTFILPDSRTAARRSSTQTPEPAPIHLTGTPLKHPSVVHSTLTRGSRRDRSSSVATVDSIASTSTFTLPNPRQWQVTQALKLQRPLVESIPPEILQGSQQTSPSSSKLPASSLDSERRRVRDETPRRQQRGRLGSDALPPVSRNRLDLGRHYAHTRLGIGSDTSLAQTFA